MEPQPTITRWCLGLPSAGFRALTPADIARIRQQRHSALGGLWRRFLPIVAVPFVIAGGREIGFGADVWMLASVVLIAIALLGSRDTFHLRRALRDDLAGGRVEQFHAVPPPGDTGAAAASAPEVMSVEVLPCSKQLLLLNGAPPDRPRQESVYESTPAPIRTAQFAVPADVLDVLPHVLRTSGRIDRRRLTPSEVGELTDRARRLRRPPWLLVFLYVWVAIGIGGLSIPTPTRSLDWHDTIFFVALVGVTALRTRIVVNERRFARFLEVARQDGWVLVWDGGAAGAPTIEFLTAGKAVWSLASRPSGWRLTATPR